MKNLVLKNKKSKSSKQESRIKNYVIIRTKSSGYVPLKRLNIVDKVLMTIRFMFDKKYREEIVRKKKQKEEEKVLNDKIILKSFLIETLKSIPDNAKDSIIQIDNRLVYVLNYTLKNTIEFAEYDIVKLKINENLKKYIKKPHKLIMVNLIRRGN